MSVTKQLLPEQSVVDFTLQECGSIEALFDVLNNNGLKDLSTPTNTQLVLPIPTKKNVTDYYVANNVEIATGKGDAITMKVLSATILALQLNINSVYMIDWGDGVVQSFKNTDTAYHTYTGAFTGNITLRVPDGYISQIISITDSSPAFNLGIQYNASVLKRMNLTVLYVANGFFVGDITLLKKLVELTLPTSATPSGVVAKLPKTLELLDLGNASLMSAFKPNDLPYNLYYLSLLNAPVKGYTRGEIFRDDFEDFVMNAATGYGLTSQEVDDLLADLNACNLSGPYHITLLGHNAARTPASDSDVAALESRGRIISTYYDELTVQSTTAISLLMNASSYPLTIDWGDGNVSMYSGGSYIAHSYATSYTGKITIHDALGGGSSITAITSNYITGNGFNFNVARLNFYTALTSFTIYGNNNLTGDVATLPSSLTYFRAQGSLGTMFGNLANLPALLTAFYSSSGGNSYSGDLKYLPSAIATLALGSSTNSITYSSGRSWSNNMNYVFIRASSSFTQAMVDAILIDLAIPATWTGTKTVDLRTLPARTTASDSAVATLVSKGVTVLTT